MKGVRPEKPEILDGKNRYIIERDGTLVNTNNNN